MKEKITTIKVLPDYSNIPLWKMLTLQMVTGHTRHIKKEINGIEKIKLSREYFRTLQAYARDQKEFFETIEEIGTVCLSEIEKEQTKLQE